LLDQLPPGFVKPSALAVHTFGGRVAPALRQRALARLATRVREVYSSNEAGNVSMIETDGPAAIGSLFPDVRVAIVDENGTVLPRGRAGRVRAKTGYMVEGYLDDPAATARMFNDGWFIPGDMGILHGEGQLEVIGRDDELLNIGGLKVSPDEIEEVILGRGVVSDVGICALRDAEGADTVYLAVCYDAPDDRDLDARLAPALRDYPLGPVRPVKLARIPRTENGKVQRAELRRAVLDAVRPSRG
jgi:acyl-CoA synthetase (AMP-forming)/AMP-acid ligase II